MKKKIYKLTNESNFLSNTVYTFAREREKETGRRCDPSVDIKVALIGIYKKYKEGCKVGDDVFINGARALRWMGSHHETALVRDITGRKVDVIVEPSLFENGITDNSYFELISKV